MLTTTTSYRLLAGNIEKALTRTASTPTVERASGYYLENISKITSIEEFLADDRLFSYAMKAFGLEDMTYAKAFMRKALEEGIDSRDSFANKLADKRYREFVETFNFVRHGETTTLFTRAQQGTVDLFVRQTLEQEAGAQNEGVRLALYFQRNVGTITGPYSILADPALLKVAQVALGIPAAAGAQDIDKQAAMIASRLDVEDLADPKKLDALLNRFTSLWELQRAPASPSPALMLIAGPAKGRIGGDLLFALQNLKLGGA